jgi:hypothetical protein
MAAKTFYEMERVGSTRYTVSHHDGVQTHPDGSPFFGIALFSNKRKKERFVRDLRQKGYSETLPLGTPVLPKEKK